MECQAGYKENIHNINSLQRHMLANKVPVAGSINLTNRCNLSCAHCYLGCRGSKLRSAKTEMSTGQWLSILDQITEAGCLFLLLTGGEVLLHPDFNTIYHKSATSGLLIDIFTNGTLISDQTVSLFMDLPPQSVEISLYGATAKTYEAVTGVKGSFSKCIQGIESLLNKKIKVKLKTMMLSLNRGEWAAMEKIASSYGIDFRMDAAVSPCLDGDGSPLEFRVDPEEAAREDFANPERADRWVKHFNETQVTADDEYLYNCGAGLTNFHINPDGTLLPCMMLNGPAYDLTKGSFEDGWENTIPGLRKIKAGKEYRCNRCKLRNLCSGCPAFFELESGSPEKHSEYLCSLAEKRLQEISRVTPLKSGR